MSKHYTIALAGNPNAGKSTIFNALTGAHQHVGNWPGKTVERKQGVARLDGREVAIVDLPGAYSLTAYSVEETITRDFIVHEHPDAVVAVVDATNLERNLYMVLQILELDAPLVLAANMMDVAGSQGIQIDLDALSARLGGVPIVATAARNGVGMADLQAAILRVSGEKARTFPGKPLVIYDPPVEAAIQDLMARIAAQPDLVGHYPIRWLAIKLLENEADMTARLADGGQGKLLAAAAEHIAQVTAVCGEDPETLIVDRRYQVIGGIFRGAVVRPEEQGLTTSEKIDRLLTHRWLGLPIFLLLMWLVFQVVSYVSAPLLDFVDGLVTGPFARWITAVLSLLGLQGTWVDLLLVNGVLAGVGGMLVFVPVLFCLYLAIALLEDSGYMARAAFVMDRFMHMLGLHGKSFLPLLVGFGCNVPAIYATRTLENPEDRRLTAFMTTFMSCGARLPVYVIFGSAFFGAASGHMIFAMYLLGIGVAVLTGFLLKRTIFKNKPSPPFVMELPPYRLPTLKSVWLHIWERTSKFIRGVTTTITAASVVIWLLLAIPVGQPLNHFNQVPAADSLFGALSRTVAPIFAPAGFPDWQASGALVSGLVAKEIVVSTLSQIYLGEAATPAETQTAPPTLADDLGEIGASLGQSLILTGQEFVNIVPRTLNLIPGLRIPEANFLGLPPEETDTTLEAALRGTFSPLSALAFSIFVLLYTPCMATIAAMRQEFGLRWTIFQASYALGVAWLAAVLVFQVGHILGLG